jgi:hypothetical protein
MLGIKPATTSHEAKTGNPHGKILPSTKVAEKSNTHPVPSLDPSPKALNRFLFLCILLTYSFLNILKALALEKSTDGKLTK